MKADEIIFRQNRVVYTLMLLLAGLGLFWSFWERQHRAEAVAPATSQKIVPAHSAANTAVLSR